MGPLRQLALQDAPNCAIPRVSTYLTSCHMTASKLPCLVSGCFKTLGAQKVQAPAKKHLFSALPTRQGGAGCLRLFAQVADRSIRSVPVQIRSLLA
eukprot:scaffold2675_cov236-Pinguiococcus_pyrenoidosus.AAC.10